MATPYGYRRSKISAGWLKPTSVEVDKKIKELNSQIEDLNAQIEELKQIAEKSGRKKKN